MGALRVALGTACTAAVIALMLYGYGPLAAGVGRVLHLPPRLAMIVAFGVLALVGQGLAVGVIQRLFAPLLRLSKHMPFRQVDALGGLAAGALVGCLLAGLLLAPLAISAPDMQLGTALRDARLSATLLEANARLLQQLRLREMLGKKWISNEAERSSTCAPGAAF